MTDENVGLRKKILSGLESTYKKLLKTKSERNLDLVVSQNGKVVHIKAKKFHQ